MQAGSLAQAEGNIDSLKRRCGTAPTNETSAIELSRAGRFRCHNYSSYFTVNSSQPCADLFLNEDLSPMCRACSSRLGHQKYTGDKDRTGVFVMIVWSILDILRVTPPCHTLSATVGNYFSTGFQATCPCCLGQEPLPLPLHPYAALPAGPQTCVSLRAAQGDEASLYHTSTPRSAGDLGGRVPNTDRVPHAVDFSPRQMAHDPTKCSSANSTLRPGSESISPQRRLLNPLLPTFSKGWSGHRSTNNHLEAISEFLRQ